MVIPVSFRDALPTDATKLSELAFGSKANWGYPPEVMQACRRELMVTTESISSDKIHYVVTATQQEISGFYALDNLSGSQVELGALFVKAEHIGKGIGRQLMHHAKTHAVALSAQTMNIQGDPHALKFYRTAGARVIGEMESGSIPGRFLPLLEIRLTTVDRAAQDQARSRN